MLGCETGDPLDGADKDNCSDTDMIRRIEEAYKAYRLSEMFLNDVTDDYGKQKIARLRLEFARHNFLTLIDEAREKGINIKNNEMIRKYLCMDSKNERKKFD